ncbi:MAG: oligoendopeptidase F [Lachnospiraceae bacterium]|nr:oligoendopeptidase F [Lachnospiraceae bacterium]
MANIESMKTRNDIDDKYKWNMKDVYADEDLWSKDIEKAKELFLRLKEFRGIICRDADSFAECMKLMSEIELLTEKIYFYANQKYHEDLGCSKYQNMAGESTELLTRFYTASSFVEPELLAADETLIRNYLNREDLQEFTQYFNNLFRQKKHILSDEAEEILAAAQKISQSPSDIFQVLNNADLKFPEIKDENGEMVRITHSRFGIFLESRDRSVREAAFKQLYAVYGQFRNTIAAIYLASVKKDNFFAEIRKYDSSRQMYLEDGNIPEQVYDNLIETVQEHLPLLHRYVKLRKRVLGLEEVHLYDLYVPLVKEVDFYVPFEKAKEMVLEGLKPMGEEYGALLKKGFGEGWLDVYENEGKRSGAYSWSVYGVHPYVLLNYQPNLNNVFTIAHEMGHALHSYYSNENQTYTNSGYKIFVAEVASTCNESLLIHHMLGHTDSKEEKAYLLNHFLEQFRTTLFRQTMFAEFEKITHEMVDSGKTLNQEMLCEIYFELNRKYFGDKIVIDKEIEMEWARIPHFYTAFYVYQYATGFSAAIALSRRILELGEPAVEDYKKFLKGGSSDYPIELLKTAGVDMGSREPVKAAMKVFEELLEELEKLV